MLQKSEFGRALASGSGIEELMDDLGHALADARGTMRMLGGGNPAHIPAVQEVWRHRMSDLLADGGAYDRMLANYDPPAGNTAFREAVAGLLAREYGWPVSRENVVVTAGGQTAFFYLFNLLAGQFAEEKRTILLPLAPEYIGYANQGIAPGLFESAEPDIEFLPDHRFKYRINFGRLPLTPRTGAICLSRPTNPSGNVLTDEEILHLDSIAREAGIPLIIDNAYGAPFPGIVFREVRPIWNENIILTLSLSKLGLPGTRTAVIVARPEIIRAVSSLNAVVGLANGNIGQTLVRPIVENGEILRLSREVIRPYYETKSRQALGWIDEFFDSSLDYHVHVSEGALFLWLWFRGLPISAEELYVRLKERGVLVVPGHYFAVGMPSDWRHAHECIRLSFAMEDHVVREGIEILARTVAGAYRGE